MEFPGIKLPYQNAACSVVSEPVLHCTDTGLRYQRFGVESAAGIVWLGKYCDGILFPEPELGYCIQREDEVAGGPYHYAWQLRPLEPDALLDLDGDGTAEKLSWRFVSSNARQGDTFRIVINGTEQFFDLTSNLDAMLYTGSLSRAGSFPEARYWKTEGTDENVYSSAGFCRLLQNEQYEQKQVFDTG